MPTPVRDVADKIYRTGEAVVTPAAWADRDAYVTDVLPAGVYGLDFDEVPMEFQTTTAADEPLDPVWCLPYGIPEVLTWHDTLAEARALMTGGA